jgi:hypothetical protein
MPNSPILEQIKSDDGVAGARARRPERVAEGARERKEAARVPQDRPEIVNSKGALQWNSHLDDQVKSDGAGGWRGSKETE